MIFQKQACFMYYCIRWWIRLFVMNIKMLVVVQVQCVNSMRIASGHGSMLNLILKPDYMSVKKRMPLMPYVLE
jgi:hypothetical protein